MTQITAMTHFEACDGRTQFVSGLANGKILLVEADLTLFCPISILFMRSILEMSTCRTGSDVAWVSLGGKPIAFLN